MTPKELNNILRMGEGFATEFKTTPSHLGREICAFANAAGGRLLIGVDEHIGSGIKRIRDTVAAYGLEPPVIEANSDWFAVTFRRKGVVQAGQGAVSNLLSLGRG
jgi:predicted HTH transcriptional regulator